MKKIIALLLALSCVLALSACGDDGENGNDLEAFTAAVSAADPTDAVLTTKVTSTTFDVTLEGEYNITYNRDGTASVTYSYQQLRLIDDSVSTTDSIMLPVEGAATIAADGTVTTIEGDGTVGAQLVAVAGVKLNLSASKMTYSVSAGMLTATIKAADTEAVLGTAVSADVNLVLTVANGAVSAITLTYDTTDGQAEIVCLYNY